MGGGRRSKTSDEMDAERRESLAHEYLCRLEEARLWMSKCLADEEWARNANRSVLVSYGGCGELLQFERSLRNGLALARLAKKFAPDGSDAAKMKIFDAQLRRFEESGLDYRHTDNINCFIQVLGEMGMPQVFSFGVRTALVVYSSLFFFQIFIPETSDVYDGKNLPRLVLCLHAVSMLLYKLGMAPQMANLSGRANFTEKELATAKATLEENQTKLPKFDEIGDMLRRERATGRMKTARLRRNFYDDKASYYHSDPGNLFKRAPYKDSLIDFQSKARDYLARDRRSFNTLGRHNFRWSGDQCDARSLPPYGHVGEMLLHQRVRGSKPRVEMPGMNSIHGGKRGGSRKTRADDSEKPRNSLVEFQARARGYLVRKKLLDCLGEDFYVCGNDNYRGIMASAAAVRERIRQKDLESLFVVKKKKPPPKPSPRKLVSDQTGPISSSSRSSGRQRVTFHTESNKEYEDTG